MNFTRGNLDQKLTVPAGATKLSQYVDAVGNWKFSAHHAKDGDKIGPLLVDVVRPLPPGKTAVSVYSMRQTQIGGGKNGLVQGFCDSNGNYIGTMGQDQETAQVTAVEAAAHGKLYWKAEIVKAGNGELSFYFSEG